MLVLSNKHYCLSQIVQRQLPMIAQSSGEKQAIARSKAPVSLGFRGGPQIHEEENPDEKNAV